MNSIILTYVRVNSYAASQTGTKTRHTNDLWNCSCKQFYFMYSARAETLCIDNLCVRSVINCANHALTLTFLVFPSIIDSNRFNNRSPPYKVPRGCYKNFILCNCCVFNILSFIFINENCLLNLYTSYNFL